MTRAILSDPIGRAHSGAFGRFGPSRAVPGRFSAILVVGGGALGRSGARSDRWAESGNIAKLAESSERAEAREASVKGPAIYSRATTTVRFRHRDGKVSCPERTVVS